MRKKNPPAKIVKFPLKSTEQIKVFGFGIVAKFGEGDDMAIICGAVLVGIESNVGLEAGRPFVDVAFNLEVIKKF